MSDNPQSTLQDDIANYFSSKLAEHGESPRGVDWNGEEGQLQRFMQLCQIVQASTNDVSVNDLGCGYGALFEYMMPRFSISTYLGIDVSENMVSAARVRHKSAGNARFIVADKPDVIADYGFASGIFNIHFGRNDAEWMDHLQETLDVMDRTSSLGFAFNCLTIYSDKHKMRDDLYYADPCRIFDICKRRYSRNVALLHDYELYEFTILVRKNL